MRKSKRQLAQLSGLCLFLGIVCAVTGFGTGAQAFLICALIFGGWMLYKVWKDLEATQDRPAIREVHADYHREPELMSRGSRGLPTNFD